MPPEEEPQNAENRTFDVGVNTEYLGNRVITWGLEAPFLLKVFGFVFVVFVTWAIAAAVLGGM